MVAERIDLCATLAMHRTTKRGYSCSSKSDDGRCIHCPDKSNTVFATFSAQVAKKRKRPQKWGNAPAEHLCVPLYDFVPDRELDFLTDSQVKLDTLVDTQEPFNT